MLPKRTASIPINFIDALMEHPAFFFRAWPKEFPIREARWGTEPTPWTCPRSSSNPVFSISFLVEVHDYPLMVAEDEKSIPLTMMPGSIPAMISGLIAMPKMKGRMTTSTMGMIRCLMTVMQAGRIVAP